MLKVIEVVLYVADRLVSSYIISLLPKKLNYRLTIYDFSQCKIEIHLIQFKNKHFKVLILSKSQKYY